MQESDAKYRVILGHERRWGQSVVAIAVSLIVGGDQARAYGVPRFMRAEDMESGSTTDWDFSGWRIRRLGEKEPTK